MEAKFRGINLDGHDCVCGVLSIEEVVQEEEMVVSGALCQQAGSGPILGRGARAR
jgi:hypothetical protein